MNRFIFSSAVALLTGVFGVNFTHGQSAEQLLLQAKSKSDQIPPFQGDLSLLRPFEVEWNNAVRSVFEKKFGRGFEFPVPAEGREYNPLGLSSVLENTEAMEFFRQSDQEELLREIIDQARNADSPLAEVDVNSALAVWANSKGPLHPELFERASKGDVNVMFCVWLIWCGNGPFPR